MRFSHLLESSTRRFPFPENEDATACYTQKLLQWRSASIFRECDPFGDRFYKSDGSSPWFSWWAGPSLSGRHPPAEAFFGHRVGVRMATAAERDFRSRRPRPLATCAADKQRERSQHPTALLGLPKRPRVLLLRGEMWC